MKKLFGCMLTLIPGIIYAISDAHLSWKCSLTDANQAHWVYESVFKNKAINTVFDACKSESTTPASCNIEKTDCVSFLNTTVPLWQCMALDKNADIWYGDIAAQRDKAALSAKGNCMKKSILPDTCYMRMFTCHNKTEAL